MIKEDFSKNEECLNWLKSKYIMLGRSLYSFLSGIESCNLSMLHDDDCNYHFYNVVSRLTTIYKMVTDLNPDEEIVFDNTLSIKELFERNKLGLMTVSNSVVNYEKPILTADQDFHPIGYPYPFSGWFHEKTEDLARSFILISGSLYDKNRQLFDTEWIESLIQITKILRELLLFFEHKAFKDVEDYVDFPFSIEGFFIHYGFVQEIKQFNPDSEYWKELKAKKGVKKFLRKWDSYVSIPIDKDGRTLLYTAFDNLGFKDIRIGELRRNLDKVSFGDKEWEVFLDESYNVIEELRIEPYVPWYYGFDSYKEKMEADE